MYYILLEAGCNFHSKIQDRNVRRFRSLEECGCVKSSDMESSHVRIMSISAQVAGVFNHSSVLGRKSVPSIYVHCECFDMRLVLLNINHLS